MTRRCLVQGPWGEGGMRDIDVGCHSLNIEHPPPLSALRHAASAAGLHRSVYAYMATCRRLLLAFLYCAAPLGLPN